MTNDTSDNRLLLIFALGSSSKNLQSYLHNVKDRPYDVYLSKNLNLDDEVFMQILPTLKVADRVLAIRRPMTEDFANMVAQDDSPLIKQAILQVTHASYPFDDDAFERLLARYANGPVAQMLRRYANLSKTQHEIAWKFDYSRRGFYNHSYNTYEKKTCSSRAHAIRKILKDAPSEKDNQALWMADYHALPIMVSDTFNATGHSGLSIAAAISKAVGNQTDQFWSIFFSMLPTWTDTYQTLIQTLTSLTKQE